MHLVRVHPEVPPLRDEAIHTLLIAVVTFRDNRRNAQSHVDPAFYPCRRIARSEIGCY